MLLHMNPAPLHESDKVRFQGCVIYRPMARLRGIYVVDIERVSSLANHCIGAKYKHVDDCVEELKPFLDLCREYEQQAGESKQRPGSVVIHRI